MSTSAQSSITVQVPDQPVLEHGARMHHAAQRVLTEGLVALGLLPQSVEASLAMHHYREFSALWYLPWYKIVIISITYANMSLSQNIERASNGAQDL